MGGERRQDPRDARIARGMRRQLAARRRLLDDGARRLGWKVAFGTPAAQRAAGIEQAVVGHLTDATALPDGAAVEVGGWRRPTIEAELAIHLGADLPPGADRAAARAAIRAVGAAIEIVDLALPLDAVEDVLAGDIFHRHVVLGPADAARAGGDVGGVRVRALLDGALAASQDDPVSVIGELPDVARFVADQLALDGERLTAGDVVIAGSAIPLLPVAAGQRLRVELDTLGALELRFAGDPTQTT